LVVESYDSWGERVKLITKGSKLQCTLASLVQRHENIAFAVAWASANTDVFDLIRRKRDKIKKGVIGTHFYQTDPNVLNKFIGFERLRFVLQPQGVFHPKVYLFWTDTRWDILIGSANLTRGALTKNQEVMIWLTNDDDAGTKLRTEVEDTIESYWQYGEVATRRSAEKYQSLWRTQRNKLNRVSGTYLSTGKPPLNTSTMGHSWKDFVKAVKRDRVIGFRERCDFLKAVQDNFSATKRFSDLDVDRRRAIAGLPSKYDQRWGYFGSMKGNGKFQKAVNDNSIHISNALGHIAGQGLVSENQYGAYIDELERAFPQGGVNVATASRLLAMKRPDTFVCLDSKNRNALCEDFGIPKSNMTFERYWGDVICRIHDSAWWNVGPPRPSGERRIWSGRAAMLDAIYFDPS
jgi:HKD family nuclease